MPKIVVLFTENRCAEISEIRALQIAECGWNLNREPYRVTDDGDVWLSERALVGQNVSDLPWEDA